MRKVYPVLTLFFTLFVLSSNAQTGDVCSNPIVANLCGTSFFPVSFFHFNNNVSTWQIGSHNITAKGPDIYYEINVPTSPFQPVSLSASLAGYLHYVNYTHKIYFLWFESNPCSSNPLAVDSFDISGTSDFPDSLCTTYPVNNVQSKYYLVIDFNQNSFLTSPYFYSLQLGFSNNQPGSGTTCNPLPPPYKGTLALDNSACYTSANPYDLPLSTLADNYNYQNLLFPKSLDQSTPYLPIADDNGNGFVLTLKGTFPDWGTYDETYTAFDQSPYTYTNLIGYYDVAITLFLKNPGGAAGIKGFKMQIPGWIALLDSAMPAGPGTYNTAGNWITTIDNSTASPTVTWLFKSSDGRGDNLLSNYGCETYTFKVKVQGLRDTIKAWMLSDNYGNDGQSCVPNPSVPPRTDCPAGCKTDNQDWVPLKANGVVMTGESCGQWNYCPGDDYRDCDNFMIFTPQPGSDCYFAGEFKEAYDDNGCVTTTQKYETIEGEMYTFNCDGGGFNGGFCNPHLCRGQTTYNLDISFNLSSVDATINMIVVYEDPNTGALHTVDAMGNIDYSTDFQSYLNSFSFDNNGPVYPFTNFSIPLTTAGTYFFLDVMGGGPVFYYPPCYGPSGLILDFDTSNIKLSVPAATICSGQTVTDIASHSCDNCTNNNYNWSPTTNLHHNDGTGASVTLSPTVTTTYSVTVTDDNGCSANAPVVVKVNTPPVAAFTGTDTICQGLCTTFTNTSSGSPTSGQWKFTGGSPSTYSGQTPPQVCYSTTGLYPVQLIAGNSCGNDTVTASIAVSNCSILPLPKASFTSTNLDCLNKCSNYTNTSTGATSWKWIFNGGTPSSYNGFTPPSVCYNTPGIFATQLIVSNGTISDTALKIFPVPDCKPVYKFVDGCATKCITFTDTSDVIAWQWTFNGGVPSSFSGKNPPPVCFADTGTFTGELLRTNHDNTFDTVYFYIRINDCKPTAAFTFTDSICNTVCQTYHDASSDDVIKWQWYFSGGNPSSFMGQHPPQVCYSYAGSYITQLVVTSRYGSDTIQHTVNVKDCSPPNANLLIPDSICKGQCLTFGNLSFNHVTTAQWDFTGGSPSSYTGQSPPSVCYNTIGNYSVRLIVSNSYGKDTITNPVVVINCQPISLSFKDTICQEQCIPFVNPVASNPFTWQWFFQGGTPSSYNGANPPVVCYNTPGTYSVTIVASNSLGNDTTHLTNCVLVEPQFTVYIKQKGDTLTCTPALAKYQWLYNNQVITGATKQSYVATKSGNYSVMVKGNSGCTEEAAYQLSFNGTNDLTVEEQIKISPNPSNGVFNISFGNDINEETTEVFNILGEQIDSKLKTKNSKLIAIDLSSQPDGVYFVKVHTTNGTLTKKVVVAR